MASFLTSSCTPLATTVAAGRMRLLGTACRLLLFGRSASGQVGVAVGAAVLPTVVGCTTRSAASARTRCSAGDQASPTPEPLILSTVVTLAKELRHWLTYPPKSMEDFKRIEITTSNCMGLCKRVIEIIFHPPGDIHQYWIDTIGETETAFVELHNQSRGDNPWASADIVEAAIVGLNRLAQIFLECCFRCTAGERASSPASEPLTAATFTTLAGQLRYWLSNPPKCMEDFKKIEVIAGKCMDLFPMMVHDFSLVPADILEEMANITASIFVELHNQSRGEEPRADVDAIEMAVKAVERMAKIFLDGAPGLTGYSGHEHKQNARSTS